MKTEQEGLLKKLFASVAKEAPKAASEKKAMFGVYAKVVSNIFGKLLILPSSHMLYVARQKGLRKWLKSYFKTV
jgi:hypothetical protein